MGRPHTLETLRARGGKLDPGGRILERRGWDWGGEERVATSEGAPGRGTGPRAPASKPPGWGRAARLPASSSSKEFMHGK